MSLEPITFDLDLRCSPEQAFDTYAVRMGDWWDGRHTADPEKFLGIEVDPIRGGLVVVVYSDGRRETVGTVLVWEPGRRYAQTSMIDVTPDAPSEISVVFSPTRSGCRCRFAHDGWNPDNEHVRPKFGDWPHLLGRFTELANTSG